MLRAFRYVLAALAFPVAMLGPFAATMPSGCGCSYVILFELHATVVDAATGQPIAAPVFVDNSTGLPLDSLSVQCELPVDGGVCTTWHVFINEYTTPNTLTISAPGYASQSLAIPMDINRCSNSGDMATQTFRLTH